ncbi:unnamed protein product [Coffea canephora]|uniref:Uncharacterized protein n=1 Tax=Coffea canephora TaxID=49390 RepID=A0A068U4H0_COFCA|nr:unnamed protein product [Coffea canephora]
MLSVHERIKDRLIGAEQEIITLNLIELAGYSSCGGALDLNSPLVIHFCRLSSWCCALGDI